ncbi:hypothetical protein MPQ_1826 [Methylovorus sp. MP688]|nr:hypothetical protein MPQ_1826 [Methylovorus sp. MP688]
MILDNMIRRQDQHHEIICRILLQTTCGNRNSWCGVASGRLQNNGSWFATYLEQLLRHQKTVIISTYNNRRSYRLYAPETQQGFLQHRIARGQWQ